MLLFNKHKHLHLVITSWEALRFLGSLCLQWSCTTFKEPCAPRCRDHTDLFVAPSLCSKAHTEKGTHKLEQKRIVLCMKNVTHLISLICFKVISRKPILSTSVFHAWSVGFFWEKNLFPKRWILISNTNFQNYTPYIFSFAWGLDYLPSVLPLNCDPTFT